MTTAIQCETEPIEQYHAQKDYLSASRLKLFRECPALYHKTMLVLIEEKPRRVFEIGAAAHCMILEPEEFERRYLIHDGPINERTGKPYGATSDAYKQWLAGINESGRQVLAMQDAELLKSMAMAVHAHEAAHALLTDGVAEAVIRERYCGEPCQIRADYLAKAGIIDLKTCADLTWFENDVKRYGYIFQLAFYRAIVRAQTNRNLPCYIVAVEKQEPFRVGVWSILPTALESAEYLNTVAIEDLKRCRAKNEWPTGFERMRVLDTI